MTTDQAWLHLAYLWDSPVSGHNDQVYVNVQRGGICFGLCGCLYDLDAMEAITWIQPST